MSGDADDPFRTGAEACGDFPDLTQREVEGVVSAIFDSITDQLAKGGRVELRGFGAFSTRQRDARVGRNPRTGESGLGRRQARALFQAGQGNARALEPTGSHRRIAAAAYRRRGWRSGRGGTVDAGDLKSSSRLGSVGSNSRRPHHRQSFIPGARPGRDEAFDSQSGWRVDGGPRRIYDAERQPCSSAAERAPRCHRRSRC